MNIQITTSNTDGPLPVHILSPASLVASALRFQPGDFDQAPAGEPEGGPVPPAQPPVSDPTPAPAPETETDEVEDDDSEEYDDEDDEGSFDDEDEEDA